MSQGDLLEGFPIHLFSGTRPRAHTVILDSSRLGVIRIAGREQDQGTVLEVVGKKELVGRRAMKRRPEARPIQRIIADARWLPFQDEAIDTIITLRSTPHHEKAPGGGEEEQKVLERELRRVLGPQGHLVEILENPEAAIAGTNTRREAKAATESYFVRPPQGDTYFVTRDRVPSSWPFRSLHHGWLRAFRMRMSLLLDRTGMGRGHQAVQIRVHAQGEEPSLVDRLQALLKPRGKPESASPGPGCGLGILVKAGWSALLFDSKESRELIKLPFHPQSLAKMERHLDSLQALGRREDSSVRALIPPVRDRGVMGGQAYWIESRLQGRAATTLRWRSGRVKRAAESAFRFLLELHRATAKPILIHAGTLDPLLRPSIREVEAQARKWEPAFSLDKMAESLSRLFCGQTLPLVRTHGDFWPGNLLVTEGGEISGVLDWDASRAQGWPLIDLLHLIVFRHKWRATWLFGRMVTRRLLPRRLPRWEKQMIFSYCKAMQIETRLWCGFVALYWLDYASQWVHSWDERRVRQSVVRPLPHLLKALGQP